MSLLIILEQIGAATKLEQLPYGHYVDCGI